MALDPRIDAIRAQYGLEASDFWQIKQNGQWVCKHAALEVVALKAKVEWLAPIIIEANAPSLVTSMIVTGKMGDRVEWATGETNETNYSVRGKQPAYPWAMSEKRAKDRVILKLVGIHGLVYSDAEGDFSEPDVVPERAPNIRTVAAEKAKYAELKAEMNKESANGVAALKRWVNDASVLADINGMERYSGDFKQEFRETLDIMIAAEKDAANPNDQFDRMETEAAE